MQLQHHSARVTSHGSLVRPITHYATLFGFSCFCVFLHRNRIPRTSMGANIYAIILGWQPAEKLSVLSVLQFIWALGKHSNYQLIVGPLCYKSWPIHFRVNICHMLVLGLLRFPWFFTVLTLVDKTKTQKPKKTKKLSLHKNDAKTRKFVHRNL